MSDATVNRNQPLKQTTPANSLSKRKPSMKLARAYDVPAPDGSYRVLVDRLLLLYGARDEEHNQAVALKQWIEEHQSK